MKRHRDALAAQAGACNTLAIVNGLLEAIREARAEHGGDFTKADRDPAVRLIAHQVAYLLRLSELEQPSNYTAAVDACDLMNAEPEQRPQLLANMSEAERRRAQEALGIENLLRIPEPPASWQEHERARAGVAP
jgi:hypothetical protein